VASDLDPSLRVRRHPERGRYDRPSIDAILDAGLVAHVGLVREGQPVVLPTLYVRVGDWLYLHGAPAAGWLRQMARGTPVAVTVTLLDGLVLARSVYNHSLNYRSVQVLGRAEEVTEPEEKLTALEALVERVQPGRWGDARPPSPSELRATRVLRLRLDRASAKVREGPPVDDPDDLSRPVWAGVIPVRTVLGDPVADVNGPTGNAPPYLRRGGTDL
jgi:nitroimidazol reductase NimA-like FMN-containing flavoprotein (pyridoxamine 5'-phosphate oxidase superfamily)